MKLDNLFPMLCMVQEAALLSGPCQGQLRQRVAAGALEKGYPAGSTLESKVCYSEVPLVRIINMLRAKPPVCGFQLEPDQVRPVRL